MKNIFLALFMVGTLGVYAKTITQTILVKGECGMCKDKIEKDSWRFGSSVQMGNHTTT